MKFWKLSQTAFAFGAICLTLAACGPDPDPNGETHMGSIVGTIIDASNGQPVPSATVVVGTNVRNVVASDGGKFRLDPVPIGNQTLVIRAIVMRPRPERSGDDRQYLESRRRRHRALAVDAYSVFADTAAALIDDRAERADDL